MPEGDKISKAFYLTIMIGTLVAGALNNITLKEQDEFLINGRVFYHPFVQTLVMFIAEFGCLAAFYMAYYGNPSFKKKHDEEEIEAEANGLKTKNNWWIPAIPAVCDITGTCLQMISMSYMAQSIYVMMRGGAPIITAFLSIIFLKKVLSKAQYLGLSLAVLGITVVGVTSFIETSAGQADNSNLIFGILCCLGSLFTTGIQFVIEEKILTTNHIHPLKMVGMEGLFGIIYTAVVIVIANNISCDPLKDGCNANGYIEDFKGAVSAIFGHGMLCLWVVLNMFSLGFFNFCGMSVTKHISSLARAILLISTTVVIWVYDLLFIHEPFYIFQLVGFIILVVGNLIYQRIIKIQSLENAPKEKNTRKGSKTSFGKASVNDCISHQLLVDEEQSDETQGVSRA
jgi:drug/metabolite transporter (DMT)-like permease